LSWPLHKIVGMQIPGLHSLFVGISGKFMNLNQAPHYELHSYDSRFNIANLCVNGAQLDAELSVLFRPPPVNGSSIKDITKIVRANQFTKINALIIGGSRGLGEVTAKIISSDGGSVTITYNQGFEDAKKLEQEILNSGGSCKIMKLNILDDMNLKEMDFNHIYYFPAPKIIRENQNHSSDKAFINYHLYFVEGFKKLLDQILLKNLNPSVFYPSTTFIDNADREFAMYAETKLEGESLCKLYVDKHAMSIFYPRLPKLATDQTLGIYAEKFQDSAAIIYPNVLRMMK